MVKLSLFYERKPCSMSHLLEPAETPDAYQGWRAVVAKYQQPDVRKSTWQIVNSFGGLFLMWIVMYLSLQVGYWLTLLLAIPTAGFLVRIFIIQHDCGHGSFFKSGRANDAVGIVCQPFHLRRLQISGARATRSITPTMPNSKNAAPAMCGR
jgi:fatty acid desaturase